MVGDQRCLLMFHGTRRNSDRRCRGGGDHRDFVGLDCVLEVSPVTIVGGMCAITGGGRHCDQRMLGKDAQQG